MQNSNDDESTAGMWFLFMVVSAILIYLGVNGE